MTAPDTIRTSDVLAVMARYPVPGATKTRLAAVVGAQAAARLSHAFVLSWDEGRTSEPDLLADSPDMLVNEGADVSAHDAVTIAAHAQYDASAKAIGSVNKMDDKTAGDNIGAGVSINWIGATNKALVEGGSTVAHAFHRAGLVDRYVVYLAPALMGGDDGRALFAGPGAPSMDELWRGRITSVQRLGDDGRIEVER